MRVNKPSLAVLLIAVSSCNSPGSSGDSSRQPADSNTAVALSATHGVVLADLGSPSSYRVLITSFDPFGGSARNNSQPVAEEIRRNAGVLGSDVLVGVCNLPVVYDQDAQAAMDCINQFHPDVVVSLGEEACSILLESAATNLDNSYGEPDNAGNNRYGSAIVPGGPERSAFDFPVQAMYCSIPKNPRVPIDVSVDPGAFICNNTAYHLSQSLTPKGIPFTFIHVPNSECVDGGSPTDVAHEISLMLVTALQSIRGKSVAGSPWPHPGTQNLLPTDKASAQSLTSELQSSGAPACEIGYAEALVSYY